MPSVRDTVMLRSEGEWFPTFVLRCIAMLRRMYSFQEDYETVKQICLCSSYRQVRSLVKACNDEDFENLIHNERVTAERIARNRRDELLQQ